MALYHKLVLLFWGKIAPETIKLMKKVYKDKCFGESMIFRWRKISKKDFCLQN